MVPLYRYISIATVQASDGSLNATIQVRKPSIANWTRQVRCIRSPVGVISWTLQGVPITDPDVLAQLAPYNGIPLAQWEAGDFDFSGAAFTAALANLLG